MIDIRQSIYFANFLSDLGWQVEKIDDFFVYLRKFPLIGNFVKIPRPGRQIDLTKIYLLFKKNSIFRLKISPFIKDINKNYQTLRSKFLSSGFRIERSPFNPTTTIIIDLSKSEDSLFNSFISPKRRAVRRALKNKLFVTESDDINSFIEIRKNQYRPLGFLLTSEMKKLWQNFYPQHASLLLAYLPRVQKPLAGILLLFYNKIAYYWFASSLSLGKKLFAPSLLVWHALKLAKKRGCNSFDFEGIADDRFPQASKSWQGFTRFKEGFGGKKVIFMENFKK